MEGQYFKKTGKLVSLSEQQLVDCSSSFFNRGCTRGSMPFAFRYAIANGMVPTTAYPYVDKV
jgi:cathepsin L